MKTFPLTPITENSLNIQLLTKNPASIQHDYK